MRAPLSALGVCLLAALIGCGGGGSPSVSTTGTSPGTSDGGSTDRRPFPGSYEARLTAAANGSTVTGSGTATVNGNGTLNINVPAANASDGLLRNLNATIAADGSATGSIVVGAGAFPLTSLDYASDSAGTIKLTAVFSNGTGDQETDVFDLTTFFPPAGTYSGSVSGADNVGGVTSGTDATATIGGSGEFSAGYTSSRNDGGVLSRLAIMITGATLRKDHTFGGTLTAGASSRAVSGTWTILSGTTLHLTFSYEVPGTPTARVTETLTLARTQ